MLNPIHIVYVKTLPEVLQLIHKRRLELQLSQTELSQKSGLHRNTLSRLDRSDTSNLSVKTLLALCQAVGLTPVFAFLTEAHP